MSWPSIGKLAEHVRSQKTTAIALVEESVAAMKKATEYNAVLEIVEERAKTRAKQIDDAVKAGENPGRLAGVPFIAKDNYLTFGTKTTAASNILKNFEAPYQAEVVNRLEAEGAILVGKANLDSFAHGGSTENSDFGPTKNPHDTTRVPGGSSGGSAAAVALGLTPFAIGSDTGGSIRQPANFSGVIGLKPTYGLVSRYGVVAMVSSTDCMGPITTNADDAALVLDVMAGQDPKDGTTIERDDSYTELDVDLSSLKVGVIKEHMAEGVDEDVKKSIQATIDKLKQAGATIKDVSLPNLDYAVACYYIVMPAEVASNLGRYDGIRFGMSLDDKDLDSVYQQTRGQGFNSEVKRRIMIGNYVLSSGYYDAYYKKAQQVRTLLIEDFKKAFDDVDILVGPVSPTQAFKLGENTDDPLKMYLADIMTVSMSLAGVPAVSVPIDPANNLPVGLQITGPQKADKLILSVAKQVEAL